MFEINTLKLKALSKITSVFLSASLIFPSLAQAHSGRTNSAGCHRRTSNGTTHCHNSGSGNSSNSDSSGSDSALYILGGVVVVGTITYFIVRSSRKNKYRSQRKKHSSVKKSSSYKPNSNYRSNRTGGGYSGIDLKLSSSVSNLNPVDGELITIELVLSNEKAIRASGVKVLTNLPSNLRFSSALSKKGKYDSSTGIWSVEDINSFETYKLTIQAIYKSNQPATVKSEIYSANEIDIDSTPNNNIFAEDDQTSIIINDNRNKKIKNNISLPLNSIEGFDPFISGNEDEELNEQLSMNQLAMSQIIEAMKYEPAFSVKSIRLQEDDYHLELQYKF